MPNFGSILILLIHGTCFCFIVIWQCSVSVKSFHYCVYNCFSFFMICTADLIPCLCLPLAIVLETLWVMNAVIPRHLHLSGSHAICIMQLCQSRADAVSFIIADLAPTGPYAFHYQANIQISTLLQWILHLATVGLFLRATDVINPAFSEEQRFPFESYQVFILISSQTVLPCCCYFWLAH